MFRRENPSSAAPETTPVPELSSPLLLTLEPAQEREGEGEDKD